MLCVSMNLEITKLVRQYQIWCSASPKLLILTQVKFEDVGMDRAEG